MRTAPRRLCSSAATGRSKSRVLRERVGCTQLRKLLALVGRARLRSDCDHAHAVRTWPQLAARTRLDRYRRLGVKRDPLTLHLDLAAAAQHEVDLFLSVFGVVVFRIGVEVGRQVENLQTE